MSTLPPCAPGPITPAAAVTARSVGEVTVLRVSGDLDLGAVDVLTAAVRDTLAARPVGLVLDLAEVPFCDTVGLRVLLSAAAQARSQGCACALVGVRRGVADFLTRVCADRALPSYADVSAAIEGLMFSASWR